MSFHDYVCQGVVIHEKHESRVELVAPDDYRAALRYMPAGKCAIIVGPLTRFRRTLAQNRRYWLFTSALAYETGMEKDQLHGYFKRKFLSQPFFLLDKHGVIQDEDVIVASSADLTRKPFSEYHDQCETLALEQLGFVLPEPTYGRETRELAEA